MLEINERLFEIDDAIDNLIREILNTSEVSAYREAKSNFEQYQELQDQIKKFQTLNQELEMNKEHISFRPELKTLRRDVLKLKRQIDMNEHVVRLRQTEVAIQEILAHITKTLAEAVSADVFVDTGLPLAPHKRHHQNVENIIERR